MTTLTELFTGMAEIDFNAGNITEQEFKRQRHLLALAPSMLQNKKDYLGEAADTVRNFLGFLTRASQVFYTDAYNNTLSSWDKYATIHNLQNFNLTDVVSYDMDSNFERQVMTGATTESHVDGQTHQLSVAQYSKKWSILWTALRADDAGIVKGIVSDMGRKAALFESRFVTSAYHNATTQAYLLSLGAKYATSAVLDRASLAQAITQMTTRDDQYGNTIDTGSLVLVIGSATSVSAGEMLENILAYGSATSNNLNKYISGVFVEPSIKTTSTGDNPWYLISTATAIDTVPVTRLEGFAKPAVITNKPNTETVIGTVPSEMLLGNDGNAKSYTGVVFIGGYSDPTKGGIHSPNGIYYGAGTP